MTTLIKRNRNLEKSIVSDKGEIEISPAGVIIRFPQNDKRKPSYSVHLDEAAIKKINESGENNHEQS